MASLDDLDFSDDDFGSDIDDAEFLAVATQAEEAAKAAAQPGSSGQESIVVDDDIEDDLIAHDFSSTRAQSSFSRSGSFRQTTLFGSQADPEPSQSSGRRNWPLVNPDVQEPPTHHKIDHEAAKTWIYPTNLGFRDYQFNIVKRALLSNVLVALPTGLGKTFIAATVMLNWFRWAPEGQIIFVAPTKPLVFQQIEACFHTVGIPRSQTATMTGGVLKADRQEFWEERRVFFMTPQTVQNDIKNGLCDSKRIVLLVVDEAHRTSGAYAYGEVVKLIRKVNNSFRVLALTATPGSTVEAVQGVIDDLGMARVEIRTDESIDIRQYIKRRTLDEQHFPLSAEQEELQELFCECYLPVLKKLNEIRAFYMTKPESITPYGVLDARNKWTATSAAQQMNKGMYWQIMKKFSALISLAHALNTLVCHGVRLFHDRMIHLRDDDKSSEGFKAIKSHPKYKELIDRGAEIVSNPMFTGHPKMDYMVNAILNHFVKADDEEKKDTRIIVFTSFRDSAEDICRFLKRQEPMIRPHVFVGQQSGGSGNKSEGMSQKQQLDIIQKFQGGTYNTLVSTSIGEEGLDIGEVDLIVCYDTSASPVRLLQRMGRTGRKRTGGVVLLLTEGREVESYKRAVDNYQRMQKLIAEKAHFILRHDLSPRILPKNINPEPDKQTIDIPIENSQPEPTRKAKPRARKKAPPKKFHMPEGVRTGFTKASRIGKDDSESDPTSQDESDDESDEDTLPELNDPDSGLLTVEEERDLERIYKSNWTGGDVQTIEAPRLTGFPDRLTKYTKTKHVRHGRACKKVVGMYRRIKNLDDSMILQLEENFDKELLKSPKKTKPFKPVRPGAQKKGTIEFPKIVPVSKVLKKRAGNASQTDDEAVSPRKKVCTSSPTKSDSDDSLPEVSDLVARFKHVPTGKPVPRARRV